MSGARHFHKMTSKKNWHSTIGVRRDNTIARWPSLTLLLSRLMLLSLFMTPILVHAQQDIMLVLDNSGSMKKNDPQFLATTAVRDFIESLSGDTRAGVIIFDQRVTLAVPITPIDGTNRRLLTNSLADINYRGQLTDSPAAVERAIYELKTKGRENATKYIVFMTDGIVDTGNAAEDVEKTKWLREELSVDAADNGIKVFSVAFTENADFFLIQSLAKKTNGEYFRALSPADLAGVFSQMRTRIEEPSQAPITTPIEASVEEPADSAPTAEVPPDTVQSPTVSEQTLDEANQADDTPVDTSTLIGDASDARSENIDDPDNILANISAEDLEALREISEIEGIPIEQLAKELYGSPEEASVSSDDILATISAEDLEALREISEIEGIPIEQLAKELYGSGEGGSASSGVVISRPGEPSMVVEPEQSDILVLIVAAAAALLGLVILTVWFIKRKRKTSSEARTDDGGISSAPPSIQTPAAFLHDISGLAQEPLVNLDQHPLMVGRVAGAPDEHLKYLVVNAPTVGRRHAVVKYKDKAFWLVDQGSVNGTYVNEKRLSGECQLRHGDRIRFHNAEFEFTQPDSADAGETMIGEVDLGEATIVADAATMIGVAAAASAVSTADAEDDMFAENLDDINIAPDAEQDLTLEGTDDQAINVPPPIPEHVVVDAETSIDEIFDVTGEDVVPAVLEAHDIDEGTAILDLTNSDSATQVLDITQMPDTDSLSFTNDKEEIMAGTVIAPASGEVDDEFDAEASAFFDDNTVGPVMDHEAGPDPTSTTDTNASSNDEDIFGVDGDQAQADEQAALDARLEKARALAEAEGETDSPPTESVDFDGMDTMLNMEAPPPEDPNDMTLDDFIETSTFKTSETASPGTVSLDRFVETGKFDEEQAAETMIMDDSENDRDTQPNKPNDEIGEEEDDGSDFFNDGSEDPTEMK